MTLPSFFLGMVISTLMGAIFHLWKGGDLKRLILYLLLGWLGFWLGHLAGGFLGWHFLHIGPLNLGTAILVAVGILLLGYWLSLTGEKPIRGKTQRR